MMHSEGPNSAEDRRLWQRCRTIDAEDDEAARFLDLAAYADGLLDIEERERIAALLAADPQAAADMRAAQALADAELPSAGLERIVARASAIAPDTESVSGKVVPLAPRRGRRLLLRIESELRLDLVEPLFRAHRKRRLLNPDPQSAGDKAKVERQR